MLVKQALNGADIQYEVKNLDLDSEAEAELREQGIMGLPTAKFNDIYYVDVPPILALIPELAE